MRRGISASGLSVALLSARGLTFSETGKQHVPLVVLPRGTIPHHQQACTHPMLSMVRSFLLSNGRMAQTSTSPSSVTPTKFFIFFGSQTGTAEAYARLLATYAVSHGFEPVLSSLDDATAILESLPQGQVHQVVICISTYGVGEFPGNARNFWKALEGGRLNNIIPNLNYTILGLGNSHNEHFCSAAKMLEDKFKALGAARFLSSKLSCELQPSGHDAAFRDWKRSIWAAMHVQRATTEALKATYTLKELPSEPRPVPKGFREVTVFQNNRLTPEGYTPEARMLTLSIDEAMQKKFLGRLAILTDRIEIMPRNSPQLVHRAVKRLNIPNRHALVEIAPLAGAAPTYYDHLKMDIETILSSIIDLSGIPSRSLLEAVACLATNESEKRALESLADDLSAGSKYELLSRGIFSVVDMLEMFPSVSITVAQLLSYAPHITPRQYSIANLHSAENSNINFDVVFNVPVRKVEARSHEGLSTSGMSRLMPCEEVYVRLAPSSMKVPDHSRPLVLIALGVGIGAARGILQLRKAAADAGVKVAPTMLFYGFRHGEKDCLFKEEFAQMEKAGLLISSLTASNDQKEFLTPMDKFADSKIASFLGNNGEIYYCGHGGSFPSMVQGALTRAEVDLARLKITGRYHEDSFSPDVDSENTIRALGLTSTTKGTIAARAGNCDMFCFQCEQTFHKFGCMKTGVCGKTPSVAALQDLAMHGVKVLSWYAHGLRQMGVPDKTNVNHLVLLAAFSTLTNVNFDADRFCSLAIQLQQEAAKLKAEYIALCKAQGKEPKLPNAPEIPLFQTTSSSAEADKELMEKYIKAGKTVGVLTRFGDAKSQNAAGVSEMLAYGLKGLVAYTDHSKMFGIESAEIHEFIQRAFAFLLTPESFDLGKAVEMCIELGKVNVSSMGLLYKSNSTLGVPKPTAAPVKPFPGKAILISGHDMAILKKLLEKTEPLGINVYTHGEMLPAHSYPELKKHKNLVGHFGGAWQRQSVEFPHFPGSILLTTNCLTEPQESYKSRVFTAAAVGWPNVKHLGDDMEHLDFTPLIQCAQKEKGFSAQDASFGYSNPVGFVRPEQYMVGFGHETIISVAPTILEEIKKGNITRFFLVGGCDGYEGERSYYTDLVARLPKTAVVLTVGCGKFRFNYMNLGTIGDTGIPRILDMGQCNDSFGAVQVALALAGALNCKVSDLPLSIVLSWFEQKAVAVLLSCIALGLKPLRVGPSLPAFITPEVLDVLVKNYGIRMIGDVDKDIAEMCGATGSS